MLLSEVFKQADFEQVFECLKACYDKKYETVKDKIKIGYSQICGLAPIKLDEKFVLVIGQHEKDGLISYDVSGLLEGDEDYYSLVFEEWSNWISCRVDTAMFDEYSKSEIAAHCYWEMAWHGWTLEDRQARLELENKEALIDEALEKRRDAFIQNKEQMTDSYLDDLIIAYDKAQTTSLESSIEIIIEALIDADLVLDQQVERIINRFDDEDINRAIDDWKKRKHNE